MRLAGCGGTGAVTAGGATGGGAAATGVSFGTGGVEVVMDVFVGVVELETTG